MLSQVFLIAGLVCLVVGGVLHLQVIRLQRRAATQWLSWDEAFDLYDRILSLERRYTVTMMFVAFFFILLVLS